MQSMPTYQTQLPRRRRAMNPPFGWRVHPFALALGIAATVIGVLGGALLVLSIWFIMFGIAVLPAACLAAIGLARHRKPGASRPSIFVAILGIVELSMLAVLLMIGGSPAEAFLLLWPAAVPGAVTLFIAALVEASTAEAVAPPPPPAG